MKPSDVSVVDFGTELCGDLAVAERREWLVTNGLGGYASGTVAGVLTRRYHGLLIAALRPPVARTLLVAKCEEVVRYDGIEYALSANRWKGGTIAPNGFVFIERFHLEGGTPVWTFALADALLEKRVWMEQGANTTYLSYRVKRARLPLAIGLHVLVNSRDHHATTQCADWQMDVSTVEHGVRVAPHRDATPFYLFLDGGTLAPTHVWYHGFELAAEAERGLDFIEDHLQAASGQATLGWGEEAHLIVSTDAAAFDDAELAAERAAGHERSILDWWRAEGPSQLHLDPPWIRQLASAADQFIVARPTAEDLKARSVIAGYHWFSDWGRDTMISLAGLTLATNRAHLARTILQTFARFIDGGMLPNYFPDAGETPEYNTVDASLWYIEAVMRYVEATGDNAFLEAVFPGMASIIDAYVSGTRYNIKMDPSDGLIYAGADGVQLTWMDAKVEEWIVTPRRGKPIEIAALWLNALHVMTRVCVTLGKDAARYSAIAERTRRNFIRFWNPATECCFDVLDGPAGNEALIRPNQLFALSLRESPMLPAHQAAIVEACSRHLLTPLGLRSLAPGSPGYRAQCTGSQRERDGGYHQGTVWSWLLGPYVEAHYAVHRNKSLALSFLEPMAHHVSARGLGSASEIFDGAAPFEARGCIAQAWTVAEILRVWRKLNSAA